LRYISSLLEWIAHKTSTGYVMAARWLLGRIYLTLASEQSDVADRVRLTSSACSAFWAIQHVKLQHRVLLPGLRQEYPTRLLAGPDIDVATDVIHPPHRYRATANISLASLLRIRHRAAHLGRAIECREALAREHRDAEIPLLNCQISERTARLFLPDMNVRDFRALSEDINADLALIDLAHRDRGLSLVKKQEWMAGTYANMAIAADRAGSIDVRRDAVIEMEACIRNLIATRGGTPEAIPDYLTIDPCYRQAFDTVSTAAFESFLAKIAN
jgi:hypothetical protein